MTLSEIKYQLEILLKNFTIDDFYVTSLLQIARQEFGEKMEWKTDADVEKWLSAEYKNSDANVHAICSAKEISDFEKEIERKSMLSENLKMEIREREEESRKRGSELNLNFARMPREEWNEKTKTLEQYNLQTSQLRKTKRTTEAELKEDKKRFSTYKRTARQISTYKPEFFIKEKQSLNYLFNALFFKEISLQPEEGYIQRDNQRRFSNEEMDPAKVSNTKEYEQTTINYLLIKTNIEISKSFESIISAVHISRTIPARWKPILEEMFSTPIPDKFGSLAYADIHGEEYDSEKNKGFCFSSYETQRTYADEAALLLLKEALQTNNFLTTEDQKVLFALSNGVSATLLFRKKGERMQTFFTRPLEIVVNRIIKTSEKPAAQGYFLINEDYVVEVEFIYSNLFTEPSKK